MALWLDKFRKRKIGQWSLGYLAGGWVAYEVLSQVAENFAWPAVIMRAVTVAVATGLPVVVILAWYHGEKGQQRVGAVELALLTGVAAVGLLALRALTADEGASPVLDPAASVRLAAFDGILMNSLAVLPLLNRSGDPDQEYFSDGLTEELMGALSRVPGLRISARTSSFAFKDSPATTDSIARVLRVRHLLTGSVRRQGDSLRVAVGLIDARDGFEVWSDTYRRPAADVFAVQEEIARSVVDALPLDPVLLATDWELPDYSTSLEAHDLYLLGKQAWTRRTGADLLRAVELFEAAIALDSLYAPAWAALAETYVVLSGYTSVSTRTAFSRLQQTAQRALQLDSLMVEAHTALGYGTAWMSYDYMAGIERIERALAIDPEYATALHWLGELLAHTGRFEESSERFASAMALDPLSGVTRADYGQALQLAGRHEDSVEILEAYLADDPGYLIAEYWLLYAALMTGRYDRADELARGLSEAFGLNGGGLSLAVRALAGEASKEAAVAALDAEPRAVSGVAATLLVALYGQLGALDQGIAILEHGADTPFQGLIYLSSHAAFAPYREHPRYGELASLVRLRE
ncbi:MAG: hypothetical protein ABFS34_09420 [Gemmatimonadota bacterium]